MNKNIRKVQLSGIRRFSNKVAKVQGALSLTLGQPDFKVPEKIKAAMIKAIEEDKTIYTSNAGLEVLRMEISNYLKKQGVKYEKDEICITVGGSEGLFSLFTTLINEGDKILIPTPAYPAYEANAKILGGEVVNYSLTDSFEVDVNKLRDIIKNENIKALVLSFPTNPTGAVLSEGTRDELVRLIAEEDILVITDEIYEVICFEDYYSVAQIEEIKEKVIYIGGFSKTFSMTGLRLGFVCAAENIMKEFMKVHQYNVSCASSISQYGAIVGLRDCLEDAKSMRDEFLRRRDYVYNRLKDMGIDVVLPRGAFYIFPSIKKFGLPSEEFCERLLNEKKVACVPGSAFGQGGEGHIRISYCYSIEELERGLNLIEEFIATL